MKHTFKTLTIVALLLAGSVGKNSLQAMNKSYTTNTTNTGQFPVLITGLYAACLLAIPVCSAIYGVDGWKAWTTYQKEIQNGATIREQSSKTRGIFNNQPATIHAYGLTTATDKDAKNRKIC